MKNFRLLCLVLLASVSPLSAEWAVTDSRSEAGSLAGLAHRHIELRESVTGDTASVDLVVFTAKANLSLRVIDNPDGGGDLASAAPAAHCAAGVNGGYFDPNFAPLGLRIIDGAIVRPLLRARLMTGVLISAPGSVQILRVGEYSSRRRAVAAVQCGPLLVDGGRPVKGLDEKRAARRTFAAVAGDRAALGVCSDASLADASRILSSVRLVDEVRIQRALNLDGGSSTAFWFKRADGTALSISEMKNVRDFVGITTR